MKLWAPIRRAFSAVEAFMVDVSMRRHLTKAIEAAEEARQLLLIAQQVKDIEPAHNNIADAVDFLRAARAKLDDPYTRSVDDESAREADYDEAARKRVHKKYRQ